MLSSVNTLDIFCTLFPFFPQSYGSLFSLQPVVNGEIQTPMGVATVEYVDPHEPIMVRGSLCFQLVDDSLDIVVLLYAALFT